MQTVQVTLDVPKESKEVIDFIFDLVEDIRAKKSITELSAENLPALMTAVSGYDGIDEEIKSEKRDDLVGYGSKRLASAF